MASAETRVGDVGWSSGGERERWAVLGFLGTLVGDKKEEKGAGGGRCSRTQRVRRTDMKKNKSTRSLLCWADRKELEGLAG
jgi:hypothetical protein